MIIATSLYTFVPLNIISTYVETHSFNLQYLCGLELLRNNNIAVSIKEKVPEGKLSNDILN